MIPRRDLLKMLTVGSASLAFAGLEGRAKAGDSGAPSMPRRVVFVYTPEGWHSASDPNTQWLQAAGPTAFTPVGMAAPLAKHKANLVMFSNFSQISANPTYDGQNGKRGGVETHIGSKAMLLTNNDVSDFTDFLCQTPKGESIDIFLGRKVGQAVTPGWPSLQLGIITEDNITGTMSFLADGSPVLSNRDPLKVYNNLFQGQNSVARLARRKSVLDLVSADMARFLATLPAADRARAAAQADAIRTLEGRLATTLSPSCRVPAAPATGGLNLDDGANAAVQAAAMLDLITAAFACDQTRVVSLVFQGVYSMLNGGMFAGIASDLHGLSHLGDPTPMMTAKTAMFAQIASLADRLAAIPEGAGTMLDNTLIIHVTEETGNHMLSNLPILTLGGKNMGVRVGNHLSLPTIATSTNGASAGFPIGGLWRSVISAMGLPDQAFGNPAWSTLVPNFLGPVT